MLRAIISAAALLTLSVASAAPVESTINECWEGHDHAGLYKCVSQRALKARRNLNSMEKAVRGAISSSTEDPSYLTPVKDKFEASVRSYERYRSDQCQLRMALAAMGNGAAEIELACEAALDLNRTNELEQGIWWLTK